MHYKNEELEELKNQYVANLEIIRKHHRKIRLDNKDLYNTSILYQIGIVNKVMSDLWESIFEMEKYLPYYKQIYLRKKYERAKKYYLKSQLTYLSDSTETEYPENTVCNKLQRSVLLNAIQRLLTPRQFEVFYMYFFQNMKKKNIAFDLKISGPTVNEHLEKAISKLKASDTCLEYLKNYL